MNPCQRSLAHLRKNGWLACVVEKFLPARGSMKFPRRIDAFGFGDILACRRVEPALHGDIALVQTTVTGSMAEHRAKILALPEFQKWKDADGIVILQGWGKRCKDGKRGARKVWVLKEEVL
jgi:hypothetical protein